MYIEHPPLFGGFIISLQSLIGETVHHSLKHAPLLGDSGSSHILNMLRH